MFLAALNLTRLNTFAVWLAQWLHSMKCLGKARHLSSRAFLVLVMTGLYLHRGPSHRSFVLGSLLRYLSCGLEVMAR